MFSSRHIGSFVVSSVVTSLLLTFALPAQAAGGDLDPSWGGTGFVITPFPGLYSFADGALARGNQVIAVGGVQTGVTRGDFAIARYNRDGTLDQTFGTAGEVTTDFNGNEDLAGAVAYQGDKLVVVGYTSPGDDTFFFALARYNMDGSLDQSFGTGGRVISTFSGYDFADAVVIKGDKIVVAGETRFGGGGDNFIVARYNKDGSLDQSFGNGGFVATDFNGGFDSANGVQIMENRILAGGYVQSPNGDFDFGLARYRSDGSLDQSFGSGGKVETDFTGGDDFAHAVDVRGQQIVAVGSASNGSDQDFAAAEYNKSGALDPGFGGDGRSTIEMGGDDEAFGGAFQYDGRVVAAGYNSDGVIQFAAARWTRDGLPDPSFGGGDGFTTTPVGADSGGFSLALGPDNRIVTAGFSDDNFAVVRYLAN